MPDTARTVQRTYLVLTLFTTLAASFIWGINTLFLLERRARQHPGVHGQRVLHRRRRSSSRSRPGSWPTPAAGSSRSCSAPATLLVPTLLYLVMWQVRAPLVGWAIASILLGLGFTFFSGATEAWLVDALQATGFRGTLESVFARAQVVTRCGDADRLGPRWRHRPGRRTSACRT